MRVLIPILIVLFLFSCGEKEKETIEELDLHATVHLQVEGVDLQHYYFEIQKDTIRKIVKYPKRDTTNSLIKTYEFYYLKDGEYTLSINSSFGYSYDTIITIVDTFSVIKLSPTLFKNYIDSFDVDEFLNELKAADTVRYAHHTNGCFSSSEEFFKTYQKENIDKIEFSFGNEFELNFDYKKQLIQLIKRQENFFKKRNSSDKFSHFDEEGNSILILEMEIGCLSTSSSSIYINLENKVYRLSSKKFKCDDDEFNFLANNFSVNYLNIKEKKTVYLPIKTEKHNNKALILSKNYIPFYDKNLIENERYSYWKKPIIEIDSISEGKINFKLSDDTCDLYNLVKTVDNNDNQWISGEYVYEFNKTGRDTSFSIQDVDFTINVTQNFGIGVSDENGLTFCDNRNPVVLYNSKYEKEELIYLDKNSYNYPSEYLTLDENNSWYDSIKTINYKNDSLILNVQREYQEGHENLTFLVEINKDNSKGKIIFSEMIYE